jgi:carbamoyltransferase
MKALMNAKIKFREGFRPFCPSVLAEDTKLHFEGKGTLSPYMTVNFNVKDPAKTPSITHVNNTARIQTVEQNENPLFYEYLRNLKKEIGVGMSINTSFNRNQEPMIHNPIEAVSAFYGSGMDALVIGNFILEKTNTR